MHESAPGILQIEAARLPAPADRYDADYAWIKDRNGAVSFFFGKSWPADTSRLFSCLEVRFPYEDFVGNFWESSRAFHEEMRGRSGTAPLTREIREPEILPPGKFHSLWANVSVMARLKSAATIDFFYMTPSSFALYTRDSDPSHLVIEPVVRIMTDIREIVRLLDACVPTVETVRSKVGAFGE